MKRMAAQTAVNGRDAFTIFFSQHPLTLAVVYSAIPREGVNMPTMTLTTMSHSNMHRAHAHAGENRDKNRSKEYQLGRI